MFAGESTVPWEEEGITAVILYGCSLLFSTMEIVTDMLETERVGTQLEVNMVSSNYAVSVLMSQRVESTRLCLVMYGKDITWDTGFRKDPFFNPNHWVRQAVDTELIN